MISHVKVKDLLVDDYVLVGRNTVKVVKIESTEDTAKITLANRQILTRKLTDMINIMADDDAGTEQIKRGYHGDEDL